MTSFGHTDFRISLSGTKFDEEADFDVRSTVGPSKTNKIDENLTFRSENCAEKTFSGVEKSKFDNLPKRMLPKFRVDLS